MKAFWYTNVRIKSFRYKDIIIMICKSQWTTDTSTNKSFCQLMFLKFIFGCQKYTKSLEFLNRSIWKLLSVLRQYFYTV